jgi:hypothetical protein
LAVPRRDRNLAEHCIGHIGWIGHIGYFYQKTGRAAGERLARPTRVMYGAAMSTISVSGLKKKPAKQWLQSALQAQAALVSRLRAASERLNAAPPSEAIIAAVVDELTCDLPQPRLLSGRLLCQPNRIILSYAI